MNRVLIAMFSLLAAAQAADLKPETLRAWDAYVAAADASMQQRLLPGHSFLWIDEAPERREQLRAGEILVAPAGEHNPRKVPSGLIHDWQGAVFFPNARLEDVLGVVRDYAHYTKYYPPSVLDARAIERTPEADRFSMLLMNKALFLKMALESEYQSSYHSAGDRRCYSVSSAIRIQEVQDYGEANEHELPSDAGSGYVWRLHSIARYEEADGGVYVEMEAIALSRDIPAMARWMVEPIVRRVSKGAMVTSLRQTLEAVSTQTALARKQVRPTLASGFAPDSRR